MAVGIHIKIAGGTAADFDRLNAEIDPDGNPPDGIMFHASGPIDGGWGVLDFWESREHYERFAAGRIGPAMGPQAPVRLAGDPRVRRARALPALSESAVPSRASQRVRA